MHQYCATPPHPLLRKHLLPVLKHCASPSGLDPAFPATLSLQPPLRCLLQQPCPWSLFGEEPQPVGHSTPGCTGQVHPVRMRRPPPGAPLCYHQQAVRPPVRDCWIHRRLQMLHYSEEPVPRHTQAPHRLIDRPTLLGVVVPGLKLTALPLAVSQHLSRVAAASACPLAMEPVVVGAVHHADASYLYPALGPLATPRSKLEAGASG
mmetsp:Transcript_123841/g.246397  ORF Transcript_123841/g.246397 Transcript_123841/m.246397 type:complete len:206 (+) Transcript_123841:4613-5230(+)